MSYSFDSNSLVHLRRNVCYLKVCSGLFLEVLDCRISCELKETSKMVLHLRSKRLVTVSILNYLCEVTLYMQAGN